jgi:Uma2 family endonuclease
MPQPPIEKEAAVLEIARHLANWNVRTRQNGTCTSSQGGFNFNGAIRAPDIAYTPKGVYRALDEEQRRSFRGDPFSPTFAVEVEDLIPTGKLLELTHKFKDTYFPAGLELGWLVDPINKEVFVFKRDKDGTVRRRKHAWYGTDGIATVLDGGDILPGFELDLWEIDEALSQVSFNAIVNYTLVTIICHRIPRSRNLRMTKTSLARNVTNPLTIYTTLWGTLNKSMHEENARLPRKVTGDQGPISFSTCVSLVSCPSAILSFSFLVHSYLIPLPTY